MVVHPLDSVRDIYYKQKNVYIISIRSLYQRGKVRTTKAAITHLQTKIHTYNPKIHTYLQSSDKVIWNKHVENEIDLPH